MYALTGIHAAMHTHHTLSRLAAIGLVLVLTLASGARAQKVPVVEKTLSNGMRLLMVERHAEPNVATSSNT
jgi:hypothetical protein